MVRANSSDCAGVGSAGAGPGGGPTGASDGVFTDQLPGAGGSPAPSTLCSQHSVAPCSSLQGCQPGPWNAPPVATGRCPSGPRASSATSWIPSSVDEASVVTSEIRSPQGRRASRIARVTERPDPWPLRHLVLRTPRLELRPDDDAGLLELVDLAHEGITILPGPVPPPVDRRPRRRDRAAKLRNPLGDKQVVAAGIQQPEVAQAPRALHQVLCDWPTRRCDSRQLRIDTSSASSTSSTPIGGRRCKCSRTSARAAAPIMTLSRWRDR